MYRSWRNHTSRTVLHQHGEPRARQANILERSCRCQLRDWSDLQDRFPLSPISMGYHGIEHPGFHTSPSSPIWASRSCCTNFGHRAILSYTTSFSPQSLCSSWGSTADDVQNCAFLAEHVGARVSTSVCYFCCFRKGCFLRTHASHAFSMRQDAAIPRRVHPRTFLKCSWVCVCVSVLHINSAIPTLSIPFHPFSLSSTLTRVGVASKSVGAAITSMASSGCNFQSSW